MRATEAEWIAAGALALAALTALVVGVLGAAGRLPRNGVLGVRTARSMSGDAAWRYVHRRFAPVAYAAALVFAAGAVFSVVAGGPVVLVTVVVAVVLLVGGSVWAHRGLGR